jgi:S1-C subfamily serine protease
MGESKTGAPSSGSWEPLFLVQYPGVLPQHVTRGRCRVVAVEGDERDELIHACATLIGAAGAPLFVSGEGGAVVGVHSRGLDLVSAGNPYNTAVSAVAILEASKVLDNHSVDSDNSGGVSGGQVDLDKFLWEQVSQTRDAGAILAYMKRLPNGKFVESAWDLLADIDANRTRERGIAESAGLESGRPERRDPRESTVYIECAKPDGSDARKGSGVIVTSRGRVLTARHVSPDNTFECWGSIGTAARRPDRKLLGGGISQQYDARLLRIVAEESERFFPIKYVELVPEMQLSFITAYGFPKDGVGQVETRLGILSTTYYDGEGNVSTDAVTARGMSGGPVVLGTDGGLVGIVASAHIDDLYSIPDSYEVLAAEAIAHELGLERLE